MKKIISLNLLFILVLLISFGKQNFLLAQQEIKLSLAEAEAIFLQNNLQIIAERFSINIAEANVIQAKLFENPEFVFEQFIYTADDGKYFDFGKQNVMQLEQLFVLAGKRKKLVSFENINLEIAQFEFQELLRELRNTLREKFIETFYLKKHILVYDKGINYLKKLIDVYDKQYEKGNVSLIERVRLKALLLDLQTEKFELEKELIEVNKELNILLNQSEQTLINPTLNTEIHSFLFNDETYNLLTKELAKTPQMQIAKKQIEADEANLKLQKAMRIPDLTLGLIYEREGHLRPENVGLYFNIPLPIFNRNQGEIKVAEAQYYQSRTLYQFQEKEMLNELYAVYSKANETLKFYHSLDTELADDFEKLIEGITLSFERKTISMLEFIDYYETYKETSLQLQNLEKETILSIEAINFLLGQNYFRVVE